MSEYSHLSAEVGGRAAQGDQPRNHLRLDLQPLTTPGQALAVATQEDGQTPLLAGQDAEDRGQGSQLDP